MKITFLKPSINGSRQRDAMQPVIFALLASLTPANVAIEFFDERLEDIPLNLDSDLVAMSVETFTAKRAYSLAERYRRQNIPVLMGGIHPTLLPDEAGRYADSVVIGTGDLLWPTIVSDAAHKRLKKQYRSTCPEDLEGMTFNRGLFAGKPYLPFVPVLFGRGCKYSCDFCSAHTLYGHTLRHRPIEKVVLEIKQINEQFIVFIDDNIFYDKKTTSALCKALLPLGKKWAAQASIDIAQHPDVLALMFQSGCRALLIGFESLNSANLALMNKRPNYKKEYRDAIHAIHRAGIMIWGSFVFGYDDDSPETFRLTTKFVIKNRLFLIGFNPLLPYPGTALYSRLSDEKRLLYPAWWLDERHEFGVCTFIPKNMTSDELTSECLTSRLTIYSYWNIIRRAMNFHAYIKNLQNLIFHIPINLLWRKEMIRKQGQHFG